MRFWRRNPDREIEGRLRDERPEPSRDLLRAVAKEIGGREVRGRLATRLAFAVVLTTGLLAVLAGFGGLSYAASTAGSSAKSAVNLAKVSVGLEKSAPSAAQKPAKANKSKGKRNDDDRKKKRRCNPTDDLDDPARDQYEDDDDRDDCD